MGVSEIKSPGSVPETPGGCSSSSVHRKQLSVFFIESDNRRLALGRGYTGGTTPVNIRGKPIANLSKTGGWIAAFFIFGNYIFILFGYTLHQNWNRRLMYLNSHISASILRF